MMKRVSAPAKAAAGIGGAVGAALLVAACSSGSSSTGAASGSSAGASSGGASTSGSTTLTSASSSGGTILTDGGRAVYVWSKDTGGMSACTGACAGVWPAVTAKGAVTGSGGVKTSELGTITRSDGTKQVTYDGHPLYFYSGDSGTGTASGQGSDNFGAKWWLVSPSGSDVTAAVTSFTPGGSGSAPSAPAPSSSSAGGSWG